MVQLAAQYSLYSLEKLNENRQQLQSQSQMAYQEYQDVYPLILLGDASVGKTCIINNFIKNSPAITNHKPTLGVDYQTKNINLDHLTVKAQIWDTAGQENYRSVTVDFMRKAAGAIIIYDITSNKSFSSVPYWIDTLRERASSQQVQIMLVGNKIDKAQNRTVSTPDAEDLARRYGVEYMEVSAADLGLLNAMFKRICESISKAKNREVRYQEKIGTKLQDFQEAPQPEQKKGCC